MLFALALALGLALLSYSATDATWFTRQLQDRPIENRVGRVGATLAEAALQLFGTGALLLPFVLGALGWLAFRGRRSVGFSGWRLAGHATLALFVLALVDLAFAEIAVDGQRFLPGGYVGLRCADLLRALFASTGATLVAVAGIVVLTLFLSHFSLGRSATVVRDASVPALGFLGRGWRRLRAARAARPDAPPPPRPAAAPQAAPPRPPIRFEDEAPADDDVDPAEPALPPRVVPTAVERGLAAARPRQKALPLEQGRRGYALPPLELLPEPEPQDRSRTSRSCSSALG